MTPGPDRFGRGGRIALLALAAYLLFLSGLLIGPPAPVLVLLATAAIALAVTYLRNPERVHRFLPRPRRRPARARPSPRPASAAGSGVRDTESVSGVSAETPVPQRRGLATGSPLLRLLLARGWRSPAEMTRDFALFGLAGLVLLLTGIALPEWPLLSWIGKVLSILGVLCMLISSGVVYSYLQGRNWQRPPD